MKTLITILLLTITLISNSYAENWLNHSKILTGSKEAYSLKADCERISGETCFDLGSYPSTIYSEANIEVDDYSKPILNELGEVTGYEKKFQKTIAQDPEKLASYQAQKAIEETARQKEASIQAALKRIDCGKRVIGLLIVRNSTKVLTTAQVAQINTTYSPIKSLIETGSLVTAKEYMQGITPDGVMITSDDKSDLVAEINKCL